jgi:hypothetical protein
MKPGAMDLLSKSKEFQRSVDNTVYHKGYPTCFRTSGVPSIQVSLTRDAKRADIDVDYRSSKFPAALVNGHLSASNSDVRAGDNDARRNNQWAGLQNWWRNLLGLPLLEQSQIKIGERVLAQEPEHKKTKSADAVFDFLNTWLVEQKPNESIGYFAQEAYACMELGAKPESDRGMARFEVLQNMIAANSRMGKVTSLGQVSRAVTVTSERLKPINQPHKSEFALYDVREDLAEEFDCVNQLDSTSISPKAAKSKAFGKYFGAIFEIQGTDQKGNVVASLWRKENEYWKLISYKIDPQLDRASVPNAATEPVPVSSIEFVDGDRELVKTASDFLTLWLVKKDFDKALQYIASECLPCVNLYRPDDVEEAKGEAQQRERLKSGLIRVAGTETVKRLEDAITAPEVYHPDIKVVKHRDSDAFVRRLYRSIWGRLPNAIVEGQMETRISVAVRHPAMGNTMRPASASTKGDKIPPCSGSFGVALTTPGKQYLTS